ncbi:MAG: thioredoxin reductase [Candidatus Vogelbacteria bacterium CG10_big_fil_rev_8_21_14_0_10_51_16]|uniref:Thioredoxin reductase n=1 Tax=Candidatus Vogelbacteria bacterium CG10_big_fil_rev_8_21_14_0_10_51_16 TaxID=1975045 RepID=A0A2H0RDX1_9BACT|nr:MAG: thioredoxin reductase [Candidatus Vogelbacteria bacterium CG10_big_fil_rev_8_21_14_0_10_51_16]
MSPNNQPQKETVYDLLIVGSGAAGLSAAIYAGRYQMRTLIVEGEFGGETAKAGKIENYPGAPSIDGYDLMKTMKEQTLAVGAHYAEGWVTAISGTDACFTVQVKENEETEDGDNYYAKSVILAGGAERRHLDLPNEKELANKGVHYCVTCDGPLYGGKRVAVVGGGDASLKGVLLLAQYAEKIYLIARSTVKGEPINAEHVEALGDKVEILENTQVEEIVGTAKLEKLLLSKEHNGSKELIVDGLFVEIGAKPNVALGQSLGCELDRYGYLKADGMLATTVPGVFVAGDTVNLFGGFKQDITAAAMGSVAATGAYEYARQHSDKLCRVHWKPAPSAVK